MNRPRTREAETRIWRHDVELRSPRFVVELRLPDGWLARDGYGFREALEPSLHLLPDFDVTIQPGGGDLWAVTLAGLEDRLDIRTGADRVCVEVHTRGAPRVVRFLESLFGWLVVVAARIRELPSGADTGWQPATSMHPLFVRALYSRTSAHQRVQVMEHPLYGRLLVLGGELNIASSDEARYSRALVRRAMDRAPRRALILGGGDCGVARELLRHPVERVVMVELDRAVLEVCVEHFPRTVGGVLSDPRFELYVGDAFEFIARSQPAFDLVIWDLPDVPIGEHDPAQIVEQMVALLHPGGTIAMQSESSIPPAVARRARFLEALRPRFDAVYVDSEVIPSFQEMEWFFLTAVGAR